MTDGGSPVEDLHVANGAMLVIISGPSGVGKDTIIDALRLRPHDPEYPSLFVDPWGSETRFAV